MNLVPQTLCLGRILPGSVIFAFMIIPKLLIVVDVSIPRFYLSGFLVIEMSGIEFSRI